MAHLLQHFKRLVRCVRVPGCVLSCLDSSNVRLNHSRWMTGCDLRENGKRREDRSVLGFECLNPRLRACLSGAVCLMPI